ncbi:MAG: phage tail protein [Ruminococcus sp.]|nr:phage tail protein [Ruminococcus sp.]
MKPRVYDRNMNMIGVLQNAADAGYDRKYNDLHTASFMLPLNDPKNDLCQAMNIVEIFDGNVSKGLYRILDNPECEVTGEGVWLEYSCEHVIAFLLNEAIDGYLELGGTNVRTPAVLRAILAKQETVRWQLGTCDFNRQFQYSWENTNVLEALFSVPKCFDVEYHWTYDLSTFPWKVNLVQQSHDRSCEVRRKRNMVNIKRTIDSSQLCTRLYCKGYGEGVNQMTIAEVNNGKPYIEDAAAIAKYGILSSHLIDRRYTVMENLKAYGQQVLNRLKNPIVTYTAKAIDLNRVTGLAWDQFDEGKVVHIIDEEKKIDIDAVIIDFKKHDPNGDPLDCEITISNKTSDVSSDIESLAQRASINSQYAQGATNLYCQQFADNADESHGAKMKFYIPQDCSRINEVLLNWSCSAFRAYSKGAAAGGANTLTSKAGGSTTVTSADGGSTTVTSNSGGATTVTSASGGDKTVTSAGGGGSTQTSSSGGGQTVTSSSGGDKTVTSAGGGDSTVTSAGGGDSTVTSAGGGDSTQTSSDGGGSSTTSGSSGGETVTSGGGGSFEKAVQSDQAETSLDGSHSHAYPDPDRDGYTKKVDAHTHGMGHTHTVTVGSHTHSVSTSSHTHSVSISAHSHSVTVPSHTHNVTLPSHTHKVTLPSHTHDVSIPSHTHNVTVSDHSHSVTIPSHTHDVSIPSHTHNVTIPSHTHDVNIPNHTHKVTIPDHTHKVELPDHTHGIVYGIFEGTTASSCTLKIDGTIASTGVQQGSDIDIVPYLSKDSNGKITRSAWHTIEVIPDKMSRIEMNLFVRTFITSHTGGNY